MRPLPTDDLQELKSFLLRGAHTTNSDHPVIEALDFRVTSSNGRKSSTQLRLLRPIRA